MSSSFSVISVWNFSFTEASSSRETNPTVVVEVVFLPAVIALGRVAERERERGRERDGEEKIEKDR